MDYVCLARAVLIPTHLEDLGYINFRFDEVPSKVGLKRMLVVQMSTVALPFNV